MQNVSRRPLALIRSLIAPRRTALRTMASAARSYNDAIDALNSLQTPHAVIEARRKAGMRPDAASMREMRAYLARIGYTVRPPRVSQQITSYHITSHLGTNTPKPADLDRLNIIHVAGTKGKGSTCAFVDSILSQYQRTRRAPRKSGLFISPHLIAVRERIRINSAPISEELFARYFFEVWDRLGSSTAAADNDSVPLGTRPLYGRYLTLMSWHAFLQEGVGVAVYETGIGGEYDATNLVERPVAAGISTLGIDHVFVLGDTVEKIAWHKAGIMKKGSPAFTIEQAPSVAAVLRERAQEKDVELKVLGIDPRLRSVKIRPDAQFQKKNATLAIALAETALRKLGIVAETEGSALPKEFVDGLEQTVFRGRCEVKVEDKVAWYVDGAHTADSLKMSSRWFADETADSPGPRVMIFNQQGRSEAVDFLASVRSTTARATKTNAPSFDHVIFCTNVTYAAAGYKRDFVNHQIDPKDIENMTVQRRFAEKWSELDPAAKVVVLPTIEEALDHARHLGQGLGEGERVQAYVTGSLHLVGGALGILEQADAL
ncbi:Folylpolyglutamate synthase [Tolypocladium ophioglossoides CBS 100239]|uniref:Folylpolyglutamate synthase n=1 Tax=Tolypocladium ophioglossoides (strain CBS 100239) TaxID=1163406 RepID=A0A0L0NBC7_TOLOC|nr:Folylpolyglutamate synthase [Tolypocladium ophioglossoides CBS 100239]